MKINVLDHGYVELVEAWGTGKDGVGYDVVCEVRHDDGHQVTAQHDYEVGIIEAARQSTQGAFRGWDADSKLLKYLHEHKHATPFEFAGMVIEVQAPIFVFREWHRHRTQSYNEASARYAPLPDLYYMPDQFVTQERVLTAADSKNKQSSSDAEDIVTRGDAAHITAQWMQNLDRVYQECEALYQASLLMGIPKELARLCMPVGHYSKMRASANLRNWLGFLTLRSDPAAQFEIRVFAEAVGTILRQTFPQTMQLFDAK